jgi:hypothetical protein
MVHRAGGLGLGAGEGAGFDGQPEEAPGRLNVSPMARPAI